MPRERDKDAMESLTEDERAALAEADAEENPEIDAKEAEVDEVVKEVSRPRGPDGKFLSKEEAEAKAKEGDELSGKDEEKAEGADHSGDATEMIEKKAEESAKAEPEKEPDVDEPKAEAPKFRPAPQVAGPEDADTKLAELATKREEVSAKFDNGDITAKEFTAELATIDKDVRAIERAQDRVQMAADMRKDAWVNDAVPGFLAEHGAYKTNPVLHNMLDAQVRHFQVAAMEAGQDPFDPAILEEAHKAITASVQSLTGQAPAKQEQTPAPKKGASPAPKRPPAPPTLANVPASEINETASEFAVLDRLAESNPEAFEDAMARLPESERARYLAAQ